MLRRSSQQTTAAETERNNPSSSRDQMLRHNRPRGQQNQIWLNIHAMAGVSPDLKAWNPSREFVPLWARGAAAATYASPPAWLPPGSGHSHMRANPRRSAIADVLV